MITIVSKVNPDSKWYFERFDQMGLFTNAGDKEGLSVLGWFLEHYTLYVDGVEYTC